MKEQIKFKLNLDNPAKINDLITRYKCYICSPNEIANGYMFPQTTLDKMKNSILGTAVVASFINNENGSRFGGHEDNLTKNQNGMMVKSPMPIGVGFADPYIPAWMEEYKGRQFLTTFIYLWTGRYQGLNTIQNRTIYQSMEVCTDDEQKSNYKLVNDAIVLGLCLLEGGDGGVEPAFTDATIVPFSNDNIQSDIDKMKIQFTNIMNKIPEKYKDLNFNIPQKVKENAKEGLDLHKEYKRGGTSVGLSTANYLINNNVIAPEKVRHIAKYFPRHEGDNLNENGKNGNPVSNGFIAWQLWGGNESYDWSTKLVKKMNDIDKEGIKKNMSNEEFKKDELGSGDYSIKINKSKDALSDTAWGDVDKTSQMHKVFKAKNAKTIVNDIYALVETGWEDAPSQHLKYPIMQVKADNEAVYNKYALKSALGYAKAENESSVISKVTSIYNKLGLTKDNAKEFSFNEEEYNSIFNNQTNKKGKDDNVKMAKKNKKETIEKMTKKLEECKYSKDDKEICKYKVIDYDDTNIYAIDKENCKMSAIPYFLKDDEVCPDVSNCKSAKLKCSIFDDTECEDSDVMMALNEKFTTDENIEGLANIARSKAESDNDKKEIGKMAKQIEDMQKKVKENETNFSKLKNDYDNIIKTKEILETKNKELTTNMSKLEEDKKKLEDSKREIEINATMSEIEGIVPEEEITKLKDKVGEFSNLDNWKEHVQAFAFRYAKENSSRIPLNILGKREDSNDIWSKYIPEENKICDK